MHEEAYRYVKEFALTNDIAGKRVLEIGSRNINGSVRSAFDGCASYLGMDINEGPGVDVVGDFCSFDWGPRDDEERRYPFDIIVSTEVLEHYPDPEKLIRHVHETLAPGGVFIVTCASDKRKPHSGQCESEVPLPGEYYQGIRLAWMRDALSIFSEYTVNLYRGDLDIYAMAVKE